MIYCCMDVDYREQGAVASAILFEDFQSDNTLAEVSVKITQVADYEPGQFYKRELPCLTTLIDSLAIKPDVFIVDIFDRSLSCDN